MDMVNFMVNLACNVLLQRWSGNAQTYDCSTTFPLCITLPPMFFRLLLFCHKQVMKHLRDILKPYELLLNLQNDLIYIKKRYAMIAPGIPEVQTN